MTKTRTRSKKPSCRLPDLGTRFLPATKAVPKEMLTVVDKPVVQYVVEEAMAAGIEHFVFVTGRNKGVIEDHFDIQTELEDTLRERGKTVELKSLEDMLPKAAGQPASPGSRRRTVLVMRSGAPVILSETNPLPCCCRTWSCAPRWDA
jgi:bifunctional N-acetylglucosamine-1-phosphate-uridyltransferase/glucosamine-1-phosphate-acetyltransferase GlmU-like protein